MDERPLSILFLESFYGGSHRSFADGLAAHSAHQIEVRGLQAWNWKWRMHGSALTFAEELTGEGWATGGRPDLLIVTSLLDVSDLRAQLSRHGPVPPILLYVHETQFDYPVSPGEKIDGQYGFRNLVSIASSDLALFNSSTHRRRFFSEAEAFLRRLPKPVPRELLRRAQRRSKVLYPGVPAPENAGAPGDPIAPGDPTAPGAAAAPKSAASPGDPTAAPEAAGNTTGRDTPLILWNHRWEHDKRPQEFFTTLFELDRPELSWQLAVAGEQFGRAPAIFEEARERLSHRTVHFGYCEERRDYERLLHAADIVVSTAVQENFGISVVEAILASAAPLLPERLSYPELLSPGSELLYREGELSGKLRRLIRDPGFRKEAARRERSRLEHLTWPQQARRFDTLFRRLLAEGPCPTLESGR